MMQTAGGPQGEWSMVIVGHQWPSDLTIAGLNAWIENRGQIADAHHNIADLLSAAKTGPLAVQQGKTADALVQLFDEGEQLARGVAHKNVIKKDSYSAALNSVHNLRESLNGIADRYNQQINQVIQSKEPLAVKFPHIMELISQGQQEANLAAANCGGDIGDAGQRILDQETTGHSFRQFAGANGVDMSQLFRARDVSGLEPAVRKVLENQDAGLGAAGGGSGPAGLNPAIGALSGALGNGGMPPGANAPASGGSMSNLGPAGVNPVVGGAPSGTPSGAGLPSGVNSAVPGLSGSSAPTSANGGGLPTGINASAPGSAPRRRQLDSPLKHREWGHRDRCLLRVPTARGRCRREWLSRRCRGRRR